MLSTLIDQCPLVMTKSDLWFVAIQTLDPDLGCSGIHRLILIAVGVRTRGSGQPPSSAMEPTGLANDITTHRSLRQWPVRPRVTEGRVERSLLNQDVKDTVPVVLCYLSLL